MAWIVLIASLMFLYGSFLMVRPSQRQCHIAKLREKAIQQGLQVRLASRLKLPEELSRPDMACLMISRNDNQKGEVGSCFKNPETSRIRCYGIFAAKNAQVEKIFSELPPGAEALISSETYVGVCWDEKGDDSSVQKIASELPSVLGLTDNYEPSF